jgi:tetratricopeptide (TPR) repeat protein
MLRRTNYVCISFLLSMWPFAFASGQTRRTQDVKVELQGQSSLPLGYSMQLVDTVNRAFAGMAEADFFGGYSFQSIAPGDYLARLMDNSGSVVQEELIRVDGVNSVIRLSLPKIAERAKPSGDRISVRQLQSPPSKNAIKAFLEAQKRSEAGQHDQSAALLEKAIQLSPEFAPAHTNLGAQYLHLRQYKKAIEEANLAMEIASPNVYDLSNRGLALWALGRHAEAMESARQALNLDSRATNAHYIIGSLLAANMDTLQEAIPHLEIASEKNASAGKSLQRARQVLAGK